MEAKDTVIKLKAVPEQIFKNQKDTREAKLAYVAGWKDGTELQAEVSFKAGEKEMFGKIRQALRGEPVAFDYALAPYEIQWLYERTRGLFKTS